MRARLVVLNYNGETYLHDCLPSIIEAAKIAKVPTKVSVIDNVSTDNSVALLKSDFSEIDLYEAKENKVLSSFNEFAASVDEDVLIFLNNDIRVEKDFVDPLVMPFTTDSDVFMVTPQTKTFDGSEYEGGRSKSCIKYGIFWHSARFPGFEAKINQAGNTMAAGFGAFSRKKFLELGGYDELYLPGRLEDNDICFRAWRGGWRCLYEPTSIVYHEGGKAFHEKFGSRNTLILGHRNTFLFFWKNIREGRYWVEHLFFLIPRLLVAILQGKPELAIGFWRALPMLGRALKRRREVGSEKSVRPDSQIFGMVH